MADAVKAAGFRARAVRHSGARGASPRNLAATVTTARHPGRRAMPEADSCLLKAIRAADEERAKLITAERKVQMLTAHIARMKKLHTADAKKAEQHPR
jgi:hypothetical protein